MIASVKCESLAHSLFVRLKHMALRKGNPGHLVWIDLEMTGLEERHVILEIATIITDRNLDVIAEGPELAIYRERSDIDSMDDWSANQHQESGLMDRVLTSDTDIRAAEALTLSFVKEHVGIHEAPLCGNSIWVDRMFLRREMPKLESYLHYRVVDVSTIKELFSRWYPSSVGAPLKAQTHRALMDVRESINELRWYRDNCFIDPMRLAVS